MGWLCTNSKPHQAVFVMVGVQPTTLMAVCLLATVEMEKLGPNPMVVITELVSDTVPHALENL